MKQQLPFKQIFLQDLDPRPQTKIQFVDQQRLSNSMSGKFNWARCPRLFYKDTGFGPARIIKRNGLFSYNHFFDAFLNAYLNHGNILLNPDQIWLMIIMHFAKYVQNNAAALRVQLVKHEGQKTLTVVEFAKDAQSSLELQKKWDYFFEQIQKQMNKNTKNNVVETLSCDFSTTTKTTKIISTALIMGSFQKFFQYRRMLCGCGIKNVFMAGVREDWVKMQDKLQKLNDYDVDGELTEYVNHMRVILANFVKTWDEEPDLDWWNSIMKTLEQQKVYGGELTEVHGWITHFFGVYTETSITSFPQMIVKVPIKLINDLTKTQKDLLLVSDWVSVSKLNKETYKPDIGLAIYETKLKQK